MSRWIGATPGGGATSTVVSGLATGNGAAAANAALIQAAMNTATTAGGGTVVIPVGTWSTSPLKLRSRVQLIGQGLWSSRLRLANGANADLLSLFDGQTEQTHVENLWLDGNKANQTAGDGIRYDNTGYDNGLAYPNIGDPNHYLRNVTIVDCKAHGINFTGGNFSGSQVDFCHITDCDGSNFYINAPDIQLTSCVSRRSGLNGFTVYGNSLRLLGCKSFLSGRLDAASNGSGFAVQGQRADLTHCEAQDNRQHGFALFNTTQTTLINGKADRNGLGPEPVTTGFAGDGLFMGQVTKSIITLTTGDRNADGLKQRWGYNCSTGNEGNIVDIAVGSTAGGVAGNGSFGANSAVRVTYGGQLIAQAAPPLAATTQTGTAYTLTMADLGTVVESNNAAAVTITVPPNSTTAFPIGTLLEIHQLGAGQVTLAPGAGVTLRSRGGALKSAGQYGVLSMRKRAADEWVVAGDVTT